jgi:hypothetical protein
MAHIVGYIMPALSRVITLSWWEGLVASMTLTDMLGKPSLLTAQRRGVKLRITQGQIRPYSRSEGNSSKGWKPRIKSSACLEAERWQPHHQTYLATGS